MGVVPGAELVNQNMYWLLLKHRDYNKINQIRMFDRWLHRKWIISFYHSCKQSFRKKGLLGKLFEWCIFPTLLWLSARLSFYIIVMTCCPPPSQDSRFVASNWFNQLNCIYLVDRLWSNLTWMNDTINYKATNYILGRLAGEYPGSNFGCRDWVRAAIAKKERKRDNAPFRLPP